MADYGRLLLAGDREGIIGLYASRGTLVIVDRLNEMMSPARTAVFYRTEWSPPTAFAWHELSCREMSPDVVIVTGAFDWTSERHPQGRRYNYSATVVREAAGWKIRSETEFPVGSMADGGVAPTAIAPAIAASTELPAVPAKDAATTAKQMAAAAPAKAERAQVLSFVRAYEPIELGLTKDEGDEIFMDFTLSLMFPLLGDYWDAPTPDRKPWWSLGENFNSQHTALFLSGTVRGGQYIWGRPSAPVVEKRFNPQLFLRFWIPHHGQASADKYLDLIYGHESNGQSISSLERFNEQREIFRQQESYPDSQKAYDRSFLSARDAISRGWDYVGLQASWSWRERHVVRLKVREFLPHGILQHDAEQSNHWEGDGPTHPRRQYDGLMLQYTASGSPLKKHLPFLTGRYSLTYTTGLSHPGRFSTFQVDVGAAFWRRPVSFWIRHGYNSDLIDYYRRDSSLGGGISIWGF